MNDDIFLREGKKGINIDYIKSTWYVKEKVVFGAVKRKDFHGVLGLLKENTVQ